VSQPKPYRLSRPRQSRCNLEPTPRLSWLVKAAAGVGIGDIGGTAGATGIGAAATGIGEFAKELRPCTYPDDAERSDLGLFYRSPVQPPPGWPGTGVGYRRAVNDSINGSTRGPDHRWVEGFSCISPLTFGLTRVGFWRVPLPAHALIQGNWAKARSRCWAALLVEWGMELTVARACRVPVGLRSGREADRPATAFIPNHLAGMLHAL
jgi:hypothetical protein